MYISRIELDTTRGKTRRSMGDKQLLHAAVEGCFQQHDKSAADNGRILWRIDNLSGKLYLLLISPEYPDFTDFAAQFCTAGIMGEVKEYAPFLNSICTGQQFRFRYCGNPVTNIAAGKGERGKVMPHITASQKCDWFFQKSQSCGFALNAGEFQLTETGKARFWRKTGDKAVEISYSFFEGILTVTDKEQFILSLTQGIGRAKAYGCGMLTVVRL